MYYFCAAEGAQHPCLALTFLEEWYRLHAALDATQQLPTWEWVQLKFGRPVGVDCISPAGGASQQKSPCSGNQYFDPKTATYFTNECVHLL